MNHSHHGHEHMNHSQHQGHGNHGNHTEYHVVHHHDGVHDHAEHTHQAYFNTHTNVNVLFENWILDTKGNIFLACLCTCLLAVGYQGTKWLRQYLHSNYRDRIHSIKSKEHLSQTVLYMSEFIVSYILMLIVMTYNVWVFLVTILGIGLGYFLCGWHRGSGGGMQCDDDCPNISDPKKRDKYDGNPSSQELMPLEGGARCGGCIYDNNMENCRETDILT